MESEVAAEVDADVEDDFKTRSLVDIGCVITVSVPSGQDQISVLDRLLPQQIFQVAESGH